jgi:hypothetical protein
MEMRPSRLARHYKKVVEIQPAGAADRKGAQSVEGPGLGKVYEHA